MLLKGKKNTPLCQKAQRCAMQSGTLICLKICIWQCKIKETKNKTKLEDSLKKFTPSYPYESFLGTP